MVAGIESEVCRVSSEQMTFVLTALRRLTIGLAIGVLAQSVHAGPPGLPAVVQRMLARAGIAEKNYSVLVIAPGASEAEMEHAPDVARNPASAMKLVTTLVALDLLGPDFRWHTGVYTLGRVRRGVLEGDLVIQGGNDPALSIARLGELAKMIRKRGIREISGNVLVDRSLYEASLGEQRYFYSERQNPANAPPDSMVVNGKLVTIGFRPDRTQRRVEVTLTPPLPVLEMAGGVTYVEGACPPDWKERLLVEVEGFAESATLRLAGELAHACGPRAVSISVLGHFDYFRAAFIDAWRKGGGQLAGDVQSVEKMPLAARRLDTWISPPLIQVVWEINKTSNNLMARQLFLQLGVAPAESVSRPEPPSGKNGSTMPAAPDGNAVNEKKAGALAERAAARVRAWLAEKELVIPGLVMENGAGLSAMERISARGLVRLLAYAIKQPYAAGFVDSLPLAGLDGTMRQRLRDSGVSGHASLKTGTLSEVRALAGYVRRPGERTLLIAFFINDRNAAAAVPAMDSLVEYLHVHRNEATGRHRAH